MAQIPKNPDPAVTAPHVLELMNNVIGGGLPAQTWRNFMLTATRSMPIRPLPSTQPSGIATVAAPERGFFDRLLGLFRPTSPPGSRPGD